MRYSFLLAAIFILLVSEASTSVRPAAARRLLDAASPANLDLLSGIVIPAGISVPSGNDLHIAFKAVGHQHYAFNGTQWILKNATAKLYDGSSSGRVVGRHFYLPEPDAKGGQPTWETFDHPHKPSVITAVTAKGLNTTRVDEDSITWNLLQATSHSGNTDDPFGHVTYVQRLKTRRGLPPSTTTGFNKGDTHSSKYSAIYAFYVSSK